MIAGLTEFEEPPVFLRVFAEPKRKRVPRDGSNERPNKHLTLVLDTETTTDTRQDLRFGISQVYSDDRLCRTVVFTGQISESEGRAISGWARSHRAEVLPVERFIVEVFLPIAQDMRAVVVGFNLPFDLSRIAADFEPKRKIRGKDAWTFWLLPRSNPNAAYTPRIRIQHVNSTLAFIGFTATKGRRRKYRGAFVDLRTFVHALTGDRRSLRFAGERFRCTRKKTEAEYQGPITMEYLDYCLNDVALTAELYQRCRDRYREFGLKEYPSRIYSPASLAKAALKARKIVPPTLPPDLTGRVMAAFYGGKVECRVVGREVRDVAVLDFTSQYPSLYCLYGAERLLTADRIRPRDTTEDVRSWVENLTLADLLRPEVWRDPRMWSLCEVEASGDILPIRSTYSGPSTNAPTIGWNLVTAEPEVNLPYMVPDLVAAKLLGGKVPRIIRATTFEPVSGQQVTRLNVLAVEVGPSDDLIRALTEARIHEKAAKKGGWEARELGLKVLANAASYGIFVEVNRKRHAGNAMVHGLGAEPFETEEEELEEPGTEFCPLIAVMITAGGHLLLAMVDSIVEDLGGEVVYCDTDSAVVTPSKFARDVSFRFDALNPYSLPIPFLKDETERKVSRSEYSSSSADTAPRFYGLSVKRYCLLVRNRQGNPHVFRDAASDHGLGTFEAPGNRKEFVAGVWETILRLGPHAADLYTGIPATAQFSLSSPSLLPRVRKIGPIRPFTFLTARFLEALSDEEARSELIPFISASDDLSRSDLMHLPRQRSWGSVIDSFVRHRDRKYRFDPKGRMIRRRILVRKDRIIGLGKEANRVEANRILGLHTAGSRAKRYADWKAKIIALPPSWARAHGIPERSFRYLRQVLKSGRIPRGHGSQTFGRVCLKLARNMSSEGP
jgi:hypothetical protein